MSLRFLHIKNKSKIVSSTETVPIDFSLTAYTTLSTVRLHALPRTVFPERVGLLGEWNANPLPHVVDETRLAKTI